MKIVGVSLSGNWFPLTKRYCAVDASFVAPVDGRILNIKVAPDGSRVLISGSFDNVNGVLQGAIASLDPTTGATRPWAATGIIPRPLQGGCTANGEGLIVSGGIAYVTAEAREAGCWEGIYAANIADGSVVWEITCAGAGQGLAVIGPWLYKASHLHDCGRTPGPAGFVGPRSSTEFIWYRLNAWRAADGAPVVYDGIGTMSKSKNNGVDPQALIEQYGADTARFFMMFASPPEQTLEWSDSGVEGAYRFLKRLWAFGHALASRTPGKEASSLRREIHLLLKQANYDLGKFQFNTVASAAMKMLNALEKAPADPHAREGFSILLRLLSPITPHVCHHLWRELGFGEDIMAAPWPEPDPAAMEQDEIAYVLQVSGKTRGTLAAPKAMAGEALEAHVRQHELVRRYVGDRPIRRIVVVPGRLINVVA